MLLGKSIFILLGIGASIAFVLINSKNDSFYKRRMNGMWWLQMLLGIVGSQGITELFMIFYGYLGIGESLTLNVVTLTVIWFTLSSFGYKDIETKQR